MTEDVVKFCESHLYTVVCPELVYLPVPRPASEIVKEEDGSFRVCDKLGRDVSKEFVEGSKDSLIAIEREAVSRGERIEGAILKHRSPSCGYGAIYDGSFGGVLIDGNGVFADMLLEEYERYASGGACFVEGVEFDRNFRIYNENNIKEIL